MAIYSALTLRDGLYVGNVGDYNNVGFPYYIAVDINNITAFANVRLYNNSSDFDANSNNGAITTAALNSTGVNSWVISMVIPSTEMMMPNKNVNFTISNDTGSYIISDDFNINPTPSTDINTGMGDAYYEEDLTTNVKKYFAEAFKFDGSQFEMDGDRIVGLKQSFIDSLATDLTNIVNTSIRTATLEADMATINQTLTALGINTDLLKTKDLRLVDAQGHEHKLHLGN